MKRNVGPNERILRLSTGVAALGAAALLPELRAYRVPLAILGVAELITGALRYCPINAALGIDNFTPGVERAIAQERRRRELLPSPGLSQY